MHPEYANFSWYVKPTGRLRDRAPQFQKNFLGSGDGHKTSQNYPLRLWSGSFGSKLMDLDGLKVSNFQLKISTLYRHRK